MDVLGYGPATGGISIAALQRAERAARARQGMEIKDHTEPPFTAICHIVQKYGEGRPVRSGRHTLASVLEAVSEVSGKRTVDLVGPRRDKPLARARQICYRLMREHCRKKSLPDIGKFMGERDHTTVMSGCKKVDELLTEDPEFTDLYRRCEQRLLSP